MHELHCCAVPEYYYRCQNFTTDLKLSHCKPNYTVVNPWKYFSFSHIALSRSKITKCPQRFLGFSVVHNLVQHAKCIWSSYNSTFFSNCDEYTSDWGEGIDCRDHGDGLVWLLNPLKIFFCQTQVVEGGCHSGESHDCHGAANQVQLIQETK